MSAETLRRAAALMHERAEAARAGRWLADGSEVFAAWQDDPRYIGVCDGSLREGNIANAEHIAGMDPTVAHAAADLLDDAAEALDLNTPTGEAALVLARAYLGVWA